MSEQDVKRHRVIGEMASALVHDRSLDEAGEKIIDVAFHKWRDRMTDDRDYSLALATVIRTVRELARMDELERTFAYIPPKREPLPRRKRKSPSEQLSLFTVKGKP